MYEELVATLRRTANTWLSEEYKVCAETLRIRLNEAANAIEELCQRVPQIPHGDLIDRREAIIDANERAYDFWLSDDEVNATIRFLNEQTTIIKAECNDETT